MPEGNGGSMDIKTILTIVALLGGSNLVTNAGQYMGNTRPVMEAKAEVTANSDFMRDELNACLEKLKTCYMDCGGNRATSGAPPDWSYSVPLYNVVEEPVEAERAFNYEAEMPYPAQMAQ